MSAGSFQGIYRGLKSFRHHGGQEINSRAVQYGGVGEVAPGRLGGYVRPEGNAWDQKGDLQSYVLWKSADQAQRPISSLSPAYASITSGSPVVSANNQPATGQPLPATRTRATGQGQLLPLRGPSQPDSRYKGIGIQLGAEPPGFKGLPAGLGGIVTSAMEETVQVDLFFPAWPNALIVPNLPGANPDLATRAYDLNPQNELHPTRHVEVQSFWTVLDLTPGAPACGLVGNVLAWNVGRGGNLDGGPGFGVMVNHDKAEYYALPSKLGGILTDGTQCQHVGKLGRDAENRAGIPAHIDVNAFFKGNNGDGPLLFSAAKWEEPDGDFGQWRRVHLKWNPIGRHLNGCVGGNGYWESQVRTPTVIILPPWIPWDPWEPPPFEPDEIIGVPGVPRIPTGGGGPGGTVTGGGSGTDDDLFGPGVGGELGPPEEDGPGSDEEVDNGPDSDTGAYGGEHLPDWTPDGEPENESTPTGFEGAKDFLDGFLGPDGQVIDGGLTEGDGGFGGSRFEDENAEEAEENGTEEEVENPDGLEPGTVGGEPPTNADGAAGNFIPLYEYGSQCSWAPGFGVYGGTTDPDAILIGGGLPDTMTDWILETPLVGYTGGIAQGDGTLGGHTGTIENGILTSSGAGVVLPANAPLGTVVGGYYDPCRKGNTPTQTYSHVYPGGLSSIKMAHPDQTKAGLTGSGVEFHQKATPCGGGASLTYLDSDGERDAGHSITLDGSGTAITGGLTVDGVAVTGGSGSGATTIGGSGADGAITLSADTAYGAPVNATTFTLDATYSAYPTINKALVIKTTGAFTLNGSLLLKGRSYVDPS